MKKFVITNLKTGLVFQIQSLQIGELQPEWGKPERWVLLNPDDSYDPSEILETRIMNGNTEIKLKAEHTIEIFDLEQDAAWKLEQIHKKRRAEYPGIEEFMDAYFDGGKPALDALQAKRLAIKAKYQKP